MIKIFKNIRLNKIIQDNSNRNRIVLNILRELGFSEPDIRKALMDLNQIKLNEIADETISTPTVYNTIKGIRYNNIAKELVAQKLNLEPAELFADDRS